MCSWEQDPTESEGYSAYMPLRQTKMTMAALWILASVAIGFMAQVKSPSGAVVLVGFAFVPPFLMTLLWNAPRQALAAGIQKARV